MATIADIRGRTTGETSLTDEQAYELFESACSRGYTAGFRLYKIYDRAEAFQGIAPE